MLSWLREQKFAHPSTTKGITMIKMPSEEVTLAVIKALRDIAIAAIIGRTGKNLDLLDA